MKLSKLLDAGKFPQGLKGAKYEKELNQRQEMLLRIQQGVFHSKSRAIVAFEGFDAAGKGGTIKRMTELLDPRGCTVHAIGPPKNEEQGRHWLYRFWMRLPEPGTIAVFDRTWYGRVLVEKVDKLTAKERIKQAYDEINSFEKMLVDDGIDVIKIFLAISPEEQWKRFEARLDDPFKQWKLGMEDVSAREKWEDYVAATDKLLDKTNTKECPWHLIPADHKHHAHLEALDIVAERLKRHRDWIESTAAKTHHETLEEAMARLGKKVAPSSK